MSCSLASASFELIRGIEHEAAHQGEGIAARVGFSLRRRGKQQTLGGGCASLRLGRGRQTRYPGRAVELHALYAARHRPHEADLARLFRIEPALRLQSLTRHFESR